MADVKRAATIAHDGERVSHLHRNDLYYAHLAIYRFALPYARDGLVLDVGAGAGYGSAYLAANGARIVHAIDVDGDAVAFCRRHFARPNLVFDVADASSLDRFGDSTFDLVFCSNTLEHVPGIARALRGVWRVLKPNGVFCLAVPPVNDEADRVRELLNPHHLHIWSPEQWRHALAAYFDDVSAYSHCLTRPDLAPDFANAPAQTVISEGDFAFVPVPDGGVPPPTLTALFIARQPLAFGLLPEVGAPVSMVDDSFSRRGVRGPAVAPAVLYTTGRPLRQLPARAQDVVRSKGVRGLATAVRGYGRWWLHRLQARRLIDSDPRGR